MHPQNRQALKTIAGGILSLAVALGISRFAYTPLLPAMQKGVGFGDDFAGYLATANYCGYLLGSVWALLTAGTGRDIQRIRLHLGVNILCTAAMGVTANYWIWFGLRLLAGVASALVFILISKLILETLAQFARPGWAGWAYAGVGFGITISALAVSLLVKSHNWQLGWIGLAGISLLLTIGVWFWIREYPRSGTGAAQGPNPPPPNLRQLLPWLVAAYGLWGLGYIVTGTFLVTLVERSFESFQTGTFIWLLVGVTAVPSCPAWTLIGRWFGYVRTLIVAQTIQAMGILLPVIIPTPAGAMAGAVCFGGTFISIAALTVLIGRQIEPRRGHRNIAVLTIAFGCGQMLGPTLAGKLAVYTNGFTLPLIWATAIVCASTLLLLLGLMIQTPTPLKTIKPGSYQGENRCHL